MEDSATARITPACAGNSTTAASVTASCQDHPRVCGEQAGGYGHPHPILGSPPRVRGTVSFRLLFLNEYRITPACAGNRSLRTHSLKQKQDHPRVCGEQLFARRYAGGN